ncbi:transmembrane glucosamine N-acetyltransferase NagX [Thalassotalea ganghwensis]
MSSLNIKGSEDNHALKSTDISNEQPIKQKQRLLSIDALRGFDMIWILGAEKLFLALFLLTGWSVFQSLDQQMQHTSWHGITVYDLIFPLFIFLSGVSLGLSAKPISSFSSVKARNLKHHAVKRLLVLMLLGVIYNHGWGVGIPLEPDAIRYASVLARIGIAWFVAAFVVWYLTERQQWLIAVIILIGYWLLLTFVTIDGYGGGDYSANGALNAWFDQQFLPGTTYQGALIDPEGILSNLPSIVNALFGVFTGQFLKKHSGKFGYVVSRLFCVGIIVLVLGYSWDVVFPINKTLWTSSFVLVTVGYSLLLLSLFYGVIDGLAISKWAVFFAVIGCNSIVAYLATSLFDWQYLTQSLLGGIFEALPSGASQLVYYSGLIVIQWLVLYWLYCRKIFIKV